MRDGCPVPGDHPAAAGAREGEGAGPLGEPPAGRGTQGQRGGRAAASVARVKATNGGSLMAESRRKAEGRLVFKST